MYTKQPLERPDRIERPSQGRCKVEQDWSNYGPQKLLITSDFSHKV